MRQIPRNVQPQRLNKEEIQNNNRSTASNEIQSLIKKISKNKGWGSDDFIG